MTRLGDLARAADVPPGYRRAVTSGLIVPTPVSREGQVWTRAEWKLLNRCTALLKAKGMRQFMKCEHPSCATAPLEQIREGDGFILRCAHADRVFMKAF